MRDVTVKSHLIWAVVLIGLIFSNAAFALPPRQHLRVGIVQQVDLKQCTVRLEPVGRDVPDAFEVQDGRTRLRGDDKPAVLSELMPGQRVRIYYKREGDRHVAVEVIWKTEKNHLRTNEPWEGALKERSPP